MRSLITFLLFTSVPLGFLHPFISTALIYLFEIFGPSFLFGQLQGHSLLRTLAIGPCKYSPPSHFANNINLPPSDSRPQPLMSCNSINNELSHTHTHTHSCLVNKSLHLHGLNHGPDQASKAFRNGREEQQPLCSRQWAPVCSTSCPYR